MGEVHTITAQIAWRSLDDRSATQLTVERSDGKDLTAQEILDAVSDLLLTEFEAVSFERERLDG